MPPYKFQLPGLQRATPVGRHNETDFGGLGMGEQAEAAGAMRMVGGSADLIQGLVAQGISTGKSDRTIGRSIDRANALMAGGSAGSNIRVNPRSFSQQAAAGGLQKNWGAQMRQSTNSFFGGESKWWNKAMVSSGVAARQQNKQPWRFSEDPGLGYRPPRGPVAGAFDYSGTDEARVDAYTPPMTGGTREEQIGDIPWSADIIANEWGSREATENSNQGGGDPWSSSIADSRRSPFYNFMASQAREKEFGFLYDQGAGGILFNSGRDSNFRNLTMSSTLG